MKPLLTALLMMLGFCCYSQDPRVLKDSTLADTTVLDEIILQSTRTSRTIRNEPTRIEIIEGEEIDEKNNMRPANVMMLLHESTGIIVQQTSATSGNASIRIQGLDGKYTQLLIDGFPAFGGFSNGLSLLEIPPLDLKQVEIIKGPASTLYGGGAIAGVVNFISKTPGPETVFNFLLNQSNIGQTNIGVYASKRTRKTGYSVLGLFNKQTPYDKDADHFTEIPKTAEFTLHPVIWYYPNEHTTIKLSNSTTRGDRNGGDLSVVNRGVNGLHQFFERNETTRSNTSLVVIKKFSGGKELEIKQSFGIFTRTISMPFYLFGGLSHTTFSEVSFVKHGKDHDLVIGGNFLYDNFNEKHQSGSRDNRSATGGLFVQHTWDATAGVQLETGFRIDASNYQNDLYKKTEYFALPRVSLLIKYSPTLSSRISGGFGYKTPTLFTEETEVLAYRNVAQLNNVISERSYGGTADINFKGDLSDDLAFSLNQLFFYTAIKDPLILSTTASGVNFFENVSDNIRSLGFETNARFIYKEDLKLFLGYTFNNAKALYSAGNQLLPLVPSGKLNSALIFEKHENFKMGFEAYFTGKQYLSNGTRTPSTVELGFMIEKTMGVATSYLNFENFTNVRQSQYKRVSNGPHTNPTFDEIWTHTEGFVVNGGIKIRL